MMKRRFAGSKRRMRRLSSRKTMEGAGGSGTQLFGPAQPQVQAQPPRPISNWMTPERFVSKYEKAMTLES
jgi:hypothetical protein